MTTGGSTNGDRPSVSALLAADRPDSQVEFFRSILNNVPAGIAIVDGEHLRIKWANDAYASSVWCGRSSAGAGNVPSSVEIGVQIAPGMEWMAETIRRVVKHGRPHVEPELLYAHPTRGHTYWRWSIMPLPSTTRASIDVVVVIVDVTEHVESRLRVEELAARAEESLRDITQRREAEAKLADSEDRYRKMGDLIPFGFWAAEPDGMLTFVNESFLEMTGTTLDECRGMGWTNLLHPDEKESTIGRWLACVKNDAFWDHEHRIRGKDGQYSTLLMRGVPIRGDDGHIRSWAGINLDVTDRKRFVTELRAAKETAEAASRSKDEFLSVISHELRTPLNPVLAAVQMLELDTRISPDVRAWVEIIRRNAELEARLIDDMLDLTRIFRGTLQLNMELVNLHAVLQNVVDICRAQMTEKNLTLKVELEATRTRVFGDSGRLQQVFWNIMKNAIKFTEVGGAITVRSADQGTTICASVMDTGIGIEPAAISRVFGAFEREGESVTRLFGGLGLGLSISKALVEMHGGKIAATSDGRDQGASFTVSLETKSMEANAAETKPGSGSDQGRAHPVRILLVDDHRDTCTLMKSMLVRRGYEVMTAENVADAVALADKNEFDLLVSDLGLPDASGLELMRRLREKRPMTGIALTGFGRDEDMQQTRDAGFAEHLIKPVNIPKLEAAIRRLTQDLPASPASPASQPRPRAESASRPE